MTTDSAPTVSAARTAYETLEPFHVLAYFNPGLSKAQQDLGIDPHAFYVGARGAPLGACAPEVVVSAFYNFAPGMITASWEKALDCGLETIADRRLVMLDEQFRAILGDRVDDPFLTEASGRLGDLVGELPLTGRSLASAWATANAPDAAHLRVWQHIAVLREWRGDNHIAALVVNGLDGIDALVFHEAQLPDPTVRRRVLGKKLSQVTRGWTDDDWDASVDRLVRRGLAERTDDGHCLTADGAALYDDIEATTDAIGEHIWAGGETHQLLADLRPYVKAVIDAGVLPGTRKR